MDNQLLDGIEHSGLAIVDGFLPRRLTRALRRMARQTWWGDGFRPARVGHGASLELRREVRRDFVSWVDEDQPQDVAILEYLDHVETLRLALNERFYLGLWDFECHLTLYPPGAFYARHLDRFEDASHRRVSVICYLNEAWTQDLGGELRIYTGENDHAPLDIAPMGGRLVMFLSDRYEHEVIAARRNRWSVTGWLCTRR